MELSDVVQDHAAILALGELVSPSLNGTSARHLTTALEAASILPSSDSANDETVENISALAHQLQSSRINHWREILQGGDFTFVSVCDAEYPGLLRTIQDRPPFLFIKGSSLEQDARAVAIVGTRNPSAEGVERAREVSTYLASRGITIVSGLAAGIDAAAHDAALEAGGRSIAVFGTGINRVFPSANKELARRVCESGAAVSQFWPDMSSTKWSFGVRNVVTSGLSICSVVIEAEKVSGTVRHVKSALGHGRRLLLDIELVDQEEWAQEISELPSVSVLTNPDQILDVLDMEYGLEPSVAF